MSSPGPRVLIATGSAAAAVDDVPPVVRTIISSASEIFVMTPMLVSRLEWYSDDFNRAQHQADDRLNTVLADVETIATDTAVHGAVGDDSPITAFADAIHSFGPDHLVIALRSRDHDGWQERRLLDRLRENFHIPMTVFELDVHGHQPSE